MQESDPARDIDYHIQELRTRIVHSLIVLTILTGIGLYLSGDILSWMQKDLSRNGLNITLNALTPYETIYTQITIGFIFGFFTSMPAIIYQLLKFAEPGLKEEEYKIIRNFLPFSFGLLVLGAAFSYKFIVKTSLAFFQRSAQAADVNSVWGLQNTVGFALKLSAVTGVLFQLPIAAVVLGKAGMINAEMMRKYRAYFIVTILLLAAIATPPDIITQIMITLPILGLYQISIFLVSRIDPI